MSYKYKDTNWFYKMSWLDDNNSPYLFYWNQVAGEKEKKVRSDKWIELLSGNRQIFQDIRKNESTVLKVKDPELLDAKNYMYSTILVSKEEREPHDSRGSTLLVQRRLKKNKKERVSQPIARKYICIIKISDHYERIIRGQ
jgi:hypothetical protein